MEWLNLFKEAIPSWLSMVGVVVMFFVFSARFDGIENDFREVKADFREVKEDVQDLTKAFYEQKTSIEVIKTELSYIKDHSNCTHNDES